MDYFLTGAHLQLSPYKQADLSLVLAVLNSNPAYIRSQYGTHEVSSTAIEQEITESSGVSTGTWLTIQHEGQLIGFTYLLVESPYDSKSWIGTLVIHADWQNRGFGTETLGLLEHYLQSQDKKSLHAGVIAEHDATLRFFGKLGYEQYRQVIATTGAIAQPVLLVAKLL